MKPTVLCFSGLDPSGGAGLQADIESVGAAGAHAAVCCTALTLQDSQQVYGFKAVASTLVSTQANHVLADLPVAAYKSGMLGTLDMIAAVQAIIQANPKPYVCDPVLVANSGGALTDSAAKPEQVTQAFRSLLPLATVVTPNLPELERLSGHADPDRGAQQLIDWGAGAVLIKRGHDTGSGIKNTLCIAGQEPMDLIVARLSAQFHGSGCSLASFLAARLALGTELSAAYQQAEVWLQSTLNQAHQAAQQRSRAATTRQLIPDRWR